MTTNLNDIMTIIEASQRYDIKLDTLKNKFKPSVSGQEKIDEWVSKGLIRQSGKTWLITKDFMKIIYPRHNPIGE